MTPPSDPLEAFKWAMNHSGDAWWIVGAIAAGIAWTSKRLGDWRRRNALAISRGQLAPARWTPVTPVAPAAAPPASAKPASASAYSAAPSYAASAYAAQPAYAAPPTARPAAAPSSHRKLHREAPDTQRAVTPFARSVEVPAAASSGWSLRGVFGDPAHAATAIITAEVLGPPVALR